MEHHQLLYLKNDFAILLKEELERDKALAAEFVQLQWQIAKLWLEVHKDWGAQSMSLGSALTRMEKEEIAAILLRQIHLPMAASSDTKQESVKEAIKYV